MNPFVVLIAAVLLVLMVMFGRNPVQEMQDRKAKGFTGDPLVDKIKAYNDEKSHGLGGTGPAGSLFTGNANGIRTGMPNQNPTTMNNPNGYGNPGAPDGRTNPNYGNQDSYYPPSSDATSPQQQQQQQQQWRQPSRPGQIAPQSMLFPPNAPMFYLGSGQPIRIAGTSVYTVNAQGYAIPMPDGRYPMFNGKLDMVVRGGKKIMTIRYMN